MSDLARNIVQIAQARSPGAGLMESACNVTACSAPSAAVVEAGGGFGNSTSRMSLRLCADHARKVRDDLSTVLERAEATLRVWTDGVDWVIAGSAERAHRLRGAHYDEDPDDMGDLDGWRALADDECLSIESEADDCGTSVRIKKTASEWVAHEGSKEGFLCSTEF